jgi:hypothetical protein
MATRNEDGTFVPGVIYYLVKVINGIEQEPFYVGETTDPNRRLKEHKRNTTIANENSTLVYQYAKKELDDKGIEWTLRIAEEYGTEGPDDLEDEHIVALLIHNCKLKNMKKGNAAWLLERQYAANDMRKRGLTSYRKYREVLAYEELERKVAEQNEARRLEELREERERKSKEEWRIRQEKQRAAQQEFHRKLIAEQEALAEQARIKREQKEEHNRKLKEAAEAKRLADLEDRARRIALDTERKQKAEAERQTALQKEKEEQDRLKLEREQAALKKREAEQTAALNRIRKGEITRAAEIKKEREALEEQRKKLLKILRK